MQHAPQRGQVALRDKVKQILDELHGSGVIELVTKSTPWISSLCWLPKRTEMSHTQGFEESNSSRELYHSHYGGYHYSST